ncbi:MAG: phage portal protein [Clostridia bacterium]|nr:phage portal protein [Clostridia bacterium]
MLDGDRYYSGDHDILKRQRTAIGPNGDLIVVKNLPNNRIVDNVYAKHVNKKADYLLGKPISYDCDNRECALDIRRVLGMRFMKTMRHAGVNALNNGIAWLYPYYYKNELRFKYFPGYEILPFWADSEHTELDAALRLYPVEVYTGPEKTIIQKVDIFKPDGVFTCIYENGTLTPDPDTPPRSYVSVTSADGEQLPFNWEHFPLIPIKANAKEIPLIRRGRSLQDAINLLESNFVNSMEEDAGSTVLVLNNYDGQDLGEFRQNLATYRAVKTRTFEGKDGRIDKLEITVDAENYKTILKLLKDALIDNLHSYDAKDDRLNKDPNEMNIQSMYDDIDLDASAMETELQAAFEEILWFVKTYLFNAGKGSYENEIVDVIFNRDILINESVVIDNCVKSVGILSDATIVAMHPWVDDPTTELERIKAQKESEMDPYRAAFEQNRGGLVEE